VSNWKRQPAKKWLQIHFLHPSYFCPPIIFRWKSKSFFNTLEGRKQELYPAKVTKKSQKEEKECSKR
jgi:hypothetical protein